MVLLAEDIATSLRDTHPGDSAWLGSDSTKFLRGDIADDLAVIIFSPAQAMPDRSPRGEYHEIAAITDATIWRFPVKSSILGDRRRRAKLGDAVASLVAYYQQIL